jgi:hypothetical protein
VHVDVDSDDEKILEGMSMVVLTSDNMVESTFQGNDFRTALDLDPVIHLSAFGLSHFARQQI